jgi:hypothetical protein
MRQAPEGRRNSIAQPSAPLRGLTVLLHNPARRDYFPSALPSFDARKDSEANKELNAFSPSSAFLEAVKIGSHGGAIVDYNSYSFRDQELKGRKAPWGATPRYRVKELQRSEPITPNAPEMETEFPRQLRSQTEFGCEQRCCFVGLVEVHDVYSGGVRT